MTNKKLYDLGLLLRNKKIMVKALKKQADSCPFVNTNCLREVFCPECPFGWLPVIGDQSK